jgi:signal transduction histidine kinase
MKFSLHRSMLLIVGASLVVALLPAGLILDRRLSTELRDKARKDLQLAPVLAADRSRTNAGALGMRAKDMAATPALRRAVQNGSIGSARRIVANERDSLTAETILIGPDGSLWDGPAVGDSMVARALLGNVVVGYRNTEGGLRRVALAPVPAPAESLSARFDRGEDQTLGGVAGLTTEIGAADAGALAGLSRSEVLILDHEGTLVAASGDSVTAEQLAQVARTVTADGEVHSVTIQGRRWWMSGVPLDGAGRVMFARRPDEELSVLPELRRGAVFAVLFALGVALVVGGLFASALVGPVETLAHAADRLASGDHEAPIQRSRIREVDRVGQAFSDMRHTLAGKLGELEHANQELEERQSRLKMLQAEMIRRDRMAASGRLVAELAHEIRNPVASVRNCLEIVRRKLGDEDREFADMAIDELLRMHELAEQMLDLNRPGPAGDSACDPFRVARNIAELARVSAGSDSWKVEVGGSAEEGSEAAIPQDALKQVLLNLVENAREAMSGGGTIELFVAAQDGAVSIDVRDRGHGIPAEVLPNIFDPFFTTKGAVRGVGLGLFIADGIVRRYGGSISASNRTDGRGATFRIDLAGAPVMV